MPIQVEQQKNKNSNLSKIIGKKTLFELCFAQASSQ